MTPLFFLHNAKAGGTSIKQMFENLYPRDAIAPLIENTPRQYRDIARNYSRFKGYKFYAGHYGYCLFEAVGDGHALVTNFRNPVSRILSLYDFWRNNVSEDHVGSMPEVDAAPVKEAKAKSFSDFIRSDNPSLRLYIDNTHYRQILDTWCVDRTPSLLGLVKVLKRIIGMKWFFVTEFPGLSQVALKQAFPEIGLSAIPIANESNDKKPEDSLSGEDVSYLIRRNGMDFTIYAFAVVLLIWRIRRPSR
ncbi:hypothetical protein ACVDG8_020595 [Mesorhizobium sp. ORM8.1]